MDSPQPQNQAEPVLPIQGGFILLARKLLTNEVMTSPPLVLKLWAWCLLKASFKSHGDLKRGQFFTRLKDIQKAMSYKIGFRIVTPTIKEIRGAMKILMKGQMMGTMKVIHGQIITIRNYDLYQNCENYEGHNEGQSEGHIEGTIPRKKGNKERKDPSVISREITSLVSKIFGFPGGEETYSKMIEAISQTRKGGKISPRVILSLLENFERYPQENIQAGIRIYLERAYHTQGKGEKYLLGIIRNHRPGEKQTAQEFKSTGSPLLDSYYRNQTEGGQA